MGRIGDGLSDLLQLRMVHFIQHQCKNDRTGKVQQGNQADGYGIPHDLPEIRVVKKLDKMLKAYPLASPDSQAGSIIFKSDLYSIDGYVMKYYVILQKYYKIITIF